MKHKRIKPHKNKGGFLFINPSKSILKAIDESKLTKKLNPWKEELRNTAWKDKCDKQ